jgi:ribosomal protein S18 acetylase RimI-like enzyme
MHFRGYSGQDGGLEAAKGGLIGFAKGQHYRHADLPEFAGELNKIYVLPEHHRSGLGRRLVGHVIRRFLSQGICSMVLFSEPDNPSGRFFEALAGERVFAKNGEFHGAYGGRDLRKLAAVCPGE